MSKCFSFWCYGFTKFWTFDNFFREFQKIDFGTLLISDSTIGTLISFHFLIIFAAGYQEVEKKVCGYDVATKNHSLKVRKNSCGSYFNPNFLVTPLLSHEYFTSNVLLGSWTTHKNENNHVSILEPLPKWRQI